MHRAGVNFSEKQILIVDDAPDNLRVLSSMLTKQGYTVRKALHGKMALTACGISLPDLILLDIKMPDMNGYEVCQHLKASEHTRDVPVIFLSALDGALDKVKAFSAGGADYITKPFQVEEVLARIENQLTVGHLQRQLAEKNARLEQFNQELTRSNAELEKFAYIASHDLQSPLQVIVACADLLSRKYEDTLDADAEHAFQEILNSCLRMKNLIHELLTYSRVGKNSLKFEPADCTAVLEEALANLHADISSSGACITHSQLPKVMGSRTQLMQLFQNLISNSIKFRRPSVPPKIEISAQAQKSGEWLIAVRDNGIGIAPENFHRLFEAFQRLHSYSQYPGSGLGMAICKKIVDCHGGRIWVESQQDVGTTICFTIPPVI
ncbi:ATP-binding protein [Kamptonema formosum]|uniref:ATP-binding protein n=1 Tax=Kamptonema formosum TaxID=331992 RepID=UPI000378099C|nr:ATP-binding protein [Oscillatoria sp. PCC 10802]